MNVYLDNGATTKPDKRVIEAINNTPFGNPSSLHKEGIEAEKYR